MKELLEKILGQSKKTPEGVRAYEDLYHICLETQKTDIPLSVEYLKKLSDIIENRIPQSETDKELRSPVHASQEGSACRRPIRF